MSLHCISITNSRWTERCQSFKAEGDPFEVTDVRTIMQIALVRRFADMENIFFLKIGDRVWFQPRRRALRAFGN